jgi:hypothetical protein
MQISTPGSAMEHRRNSTIIVHGTVRAAVSVNASAARQVTIVTPQGVVFDVEPTFIGATLGRLEGYRVAARAHLVRGTGDHPIIRVASLTIFGRDRTEGCVPASATVAEPAFPVTDADSQALDVGGVES